MESVNPHIPRSAVSVGIPNMSRAFKCRFRNQRIKGMDPREPVQSLFRAETLEYTNHHLRRLLLPFF